MFKVVKAESLTENIYLIGSERQERIGKILRAWTVVIVRMDEKGRGYPDNL